MLIDDKEFENSQILFKANNYIDITGMTTNNIVKCKDYQIITQGLINT